MTSEVCRRADALRQDAAYLLNDLGLWAIIEAAGPANIVGSYTYDLMTRPDIDVDLLLTHEQDSATLFALGTRVMSRLTVSRIVYENEFIHNNPRFDHGLYLGVHLPHRGRYWQVDIWGFDAELYASGKAESEALHSQLRKIDREVILTLKESLMQRGEYRTTVSSLALYDAVIGGVRTLADFDGWWAARS